MVWRTEYRRTATGQSRWEKTPARKAVRASRAVLCVRSRAWRAFQEQSESAARCSISCDNDDCNLGRRVCAASGRGRPRPRRRLEASKICLTGGSPGSSRHRADRVAAWPVWHVARPPQRAQRKPWKFRPGQDSRRSALRVCQMSSSGWSVVPPTKHAAGCM